MKTFLQPTATTLLDRASALSRARVPFVLATVVRAQGPATSAAGDIALLHADGWIDGFIGGPTVEASLREHGRRVLETNRPTLLRIVSTDVLVPAEEGTVTVIDPLLAGGGLDVFLEARLPAPRVLVVGDTPLVRAMSTVGTMLGFAVEQVDSWGDGAGQRPSAHDAAYVIASTGQGETRMIEAALRSGVPYVGLVATAARSAQVLAALDLDDADRARVHAPAGLEIGASTAPEVALSVFAQVVAGLKDAPAAAPAAPAAAAAPAVEAAAVPVPEEEAPVPVLAAVAELPAPAVEEEPLELPSRRTEDVDRYARVLDDDYEPWGRDRSARPALNSVRDRGDDLATRESAHVQAPRESSYAPASLGERDDDALTLSFERGDATRVRSLPAVGRA